MHVHLFEVVALPLSIICGLKPPTGIFVEVNIDVVFIELKVGFAGPMLLNLFASMPSYVDFHGGIIREGARWRFFCANLCYEAAFAAHHAHLAYWRISNLPVFFNGCRGSTPTRFRHS